MRQSLVELGKTVTETPKVWLAEGNAVLGLIREVHGAERVDAILARDSGVLVAIPHLGDWEVCGIYLARYDFTALFRPPRPGETRPVTELTAGRLPPAAPRPGVRSGYGSPCAPQRS